MEKSLEERIVDAILEDLTDRRGFRQEWDLVDEDVRSEIKERWMNIVVEESQNFLRELSEG